MSINYVLIEQLKYIILYELKYYIDIDLTDDIINNQIKLSPNRVISEFATYF